MEERRSSSPPPRPKATTGEWLLTFPEKRPPGFRRPPGRAERAFNVVSILVLILFAMGWSWSIARAGARRWRSGYSGDRQHRDGAYRQSSAVSRLSHERRSHRPRRARAWRKWQASRPNSAGGNADYADSGRHASTRSRDDLFLWLGGRIHVNVCRSPAPGDLEPGA